MTRGPLSSGAQSLSVKWSYRPSPVPGTAQSSVNAGWRQLQRPQGLAQSPQPLVLSCPFAFSHALPSPATAAHSTLSGLSSCWTEGPRSHWRWRCFPGPGPAEVLWGAASFSSPCPPGAPDTTATHMAPAASIPQGSGCSLPRRVLAGGSSCCLLMACLPHPDFLPSPRAHPWLQPPPGAL